MINYANTAAAVCSPQWFVREGNKRWEVWNKGGTAPVCYFAHKDDADAMVQGLAKCKITS